MHHFQTLLNRSIKRTFPIEDVTFSGAGGILSKQKLVHVFANETMSGAAEI